MKSLHLDMGRIWRGGQRQCYLLCRNLAAAGHETHLVCRRAAPLWREAQGSGAILHALNSAGEMDVAAALRLALLVRRDGPRLLAAHDAHAFGLLALAKFLAGFRAPIVYHRRVDVPIGRWFGSRWKLRRASRFICVSRRIAAMVEQSGVDSRLIRVVHSGTAGVERSPGARDGICRQLGIEPAVTLLAAVGGLIAHKGHRVLLEACARLEAPGCDLHLLLVGDGPLRGHLEAQAERLGLSRRVHFLGERRDLGTLFGAMDLFVHPSLTEGLGTSILDAFASGVPVIASRTGGIPEIVRDGETGRLAEPGDVKSLANAIDRALGDRAASLEMAAKARRLFQESFTDQAMARATLACYTELLAD